MGRPEAGQRLSDLTELFIQARKEPDLADALRQQAAALWQPPTDTKADLIGYVDRLAEHCPPPESLDWFFDTFGAHLPLEGYNIGGARATLRNLLKRRPDLCDEAAERLVQPHPDTGFSPAQMVSLQDLATSRKWTPTDRQMKVLTDRLHENLANGPATSGPHARENQYLATLLGDIKKVHSDKIEPGLGRKLLSGLLEDPERGLYTVYGLEPSNQGYRSAPTYRLAFPDAELEGELLGRLEDGLESQQSRDLLMVLAGSVEHTNGAERLATRLKADIKRRHEPEYVDRILDDVVGHWLKESPATPEQAVEQQSALAYRWHVMQGRPSSLEPSPKKHELTLEPAWLKAINPGTPEGQARVVVAHQALPRQPELMDVLLDELAPWLAKSPPDWPPAREAFLALKTEDFSRRLPEDYGELLRGFRHVAPALGTEKWLEVASTRFEPELRSLTPLMDGLPTAVQGNLLEKLADRPDDIPCLAGLAQLPQESRTGGVVQVLDAPVPPSFFARLLEAAPENVGMCLKAHADLCRRVEAGLDPEVAYQQVTAPLVLGGRAPELGGIGMHEGYLVVGGHRLRRR